MREWTHYKEILDLIYFASGMVISLPKSSIYWYNLKETELEMLKTIFPYEQKDLNAFLKYFLKPNGHQFTDWLWMISKIEKRIKN